MFERLKQGLAALPGAEGGSAGPVARFKEFSARTELWASVLELQPGHGPETRVRLEVHDDEKVYEIGTTTQIPRGATLEVGDHVALASLRQLTRSEVRRSPREMIKEELISEAAFDLLPAWMPGPRQRPTDRWDNGQQPSWKIDWDAEPHYGAPRPSPAAMEQQILAQVPRPAAGPSLEAMRDSGEMTAEACAQAIAVRNEALARLDALRSSGTLTEEQYQANRALLP